MNRHRAKVILFLSFVTIVLLMGIINKYGNTGLLKVPKTVWPTKSDLKGRPTVHMFPTFTETEAKHREDQVLPVFTNTDGVGSMGYTDPTKSTFSVKYGKPIVFGEFFSIIIEARDANGRHRVQGGDFWYAVVSTGKRFATAGKVIDYKNGTYELVFFAGWHGEMTLNIKLVLTSEAVQFFLHDIWHRAGRKVWGGQFKDGELLERSLCRLETRGVWHDKCEYPNPLALGGSFVMLCDRPPTLPCSSFYAFHSRYKPAKTEVEVRYSSIRTTHSDFFTTKANFAPLQNGTIQLKSETNGNFTIESVINSLNLQKCRPDIPEPLSDGFWENSTWHSFACNAKLWTTDEIKVCIKGKNLIFMGDSTTRQWCEKLLYYFGLGLPKTYSVGSIYVQNDIINMTFRFHPYILSSRLELKDFGKFEVDQLDSLPNDTCDYIIMISPWAHYDFWTKEAYKTRLKNIRAGIIKFRKRCPESVFVIKSPHPKQERGPSKGEITGWLASDVLYYQFRRLLRETFSGISVHFIDIWDMNLSYYTPNTIHMPMDVLLQELFMYFSHVCSN
ncbi:NXPE family member 3-like [Anneissia japonica]|uniref:NXPE family member 3-like n=1 Tax=Anneissia japonica TaxID=1529436 RepID=UPI0014255E1D|nr:NXPE family member 3-like [Anneissia japonica]